MPASVTEAELRTLFSEHGEVVNVKFFPYVTHFKLIMLKNIHNIFRTEKRMALVQMATVADATSSLIALHNFRFENSKIPIRISFAKSAIYT